MIVTKQLKVPIKILSSEVSLMWDKNFMRELQQIRRQTINCEAFLSHAGPSTLLSDLPYVMEQIAIFSITAACSNKA